MEERFYKDILDNLYDGVYFVDRNRVITYWNKGAERITGYTAQQAIGRACHDNLLNHITANGIQLCTSGCPLAASMLDGNPREAEVFVHHANGHRVPIHVRAAPIYDTADNIIGAVETFSNNARLIETRRYADEMEKTALTDPLTGVGNRRQFEARLTARIMEFHHTHAAFGLLFGDIDKFKQVNDSFGHDTGDRILRMVASTFRANLRVSDTVGRWGGEEFVMLLDGVSSEALAVVAEKLRFLVSQSRLDLETQSVSVTVSLGGTLVTPEDTGKTIIERADQLMYTSKQAGRNRVTIG